MYWQKSTKTFAVFNNAGHYKRIKLIKLEIHSPILSDNLVTTVTTDKSDKKCRFLLLQFSTSTVKELSTSRRTSVCFVNKNNVVFSVVSANF